ncbi:MAG TPA: DegT/DnrJ/EryC1/StrS family aminotransferase [Gaiellaceae bacterium]|nr:DegT/DnrJ/EryC1/StrS family aminotransferase [Gaiellaceae bacterium]
MVSKPEAGARVDEVVRLARPDVGEDELAEIREVLESGTLTMGPKVAELESLVAAAAGTAHAVAVSSGTAALHVAVLALGLGPGDEVLVPAYTFPATANVVALVGATPVLVDVDPLTMNIDPAHAARRVTPRTRAVLAVHLFGRPARLEELPDLPVLEDAAGALGASRAGRPCGSLGSLACFSFHPRKIVTTGEGGAITTSDDGIAERARSLRHHGWSPSDAYVDMPRPAFNYRLSDVLAALGVPQLRRLDELHAAYERVADGYAERLAHLDVVLPTTDPGDRHGLQAYVIQVDERDRVLEGLRARGIQCQIGTYALHRLGAYRDQGPFPGADAAFERALALPLHARLTGTELDRVAEALDKLVSSH